MNLDAKLNYRLAIIIGVVSFFSSCGKKTSQSPSGVFQSTQSGEVDGDEDGEPSTNSADIEAEPKGGSKVPKPPSNDNIPGGGSEWPQTDIPPGQPKPTKKSHVGVMPSDGTGSELDWFPKCGPGIPGSDPELSGITKADWMAAFAKNMATKETGKYADVGPFGDVATEKHGGYVVHYPKKLGENGFKHPIIVWSNPAGGFSGFYDKFNDMVASYGFVVAAHTSPMQFTTDFPIGGLDLLFQLASDPKSRFNGKLNTSKVGMAGHSLGAAAAGIVSLYDPRVTTAALWGVWWCPPPKRVLPKNVTMLMISGGKYDLDSFAELDAIQGEGKMVALNLTTAIHQYPTYDGGDFRAPTIAWLLSQLMDDQEALDYFTGPECPLCTNKDWIIRSKNWFRGLPYDEYPW